MRYRRPVRFTLDQLNSAERALWEAFRTGDPVDLTNATERSVRAEVVAALLRGAQPPEPGEAARIHLTAATITGVLDLTNATVVVPLALYDCVFDSAPDLTGASMRAVVIRGCHLPGLKGHLLRVQGHLDLRQSVVRGRLGLVRATVTGELRLNGAHLINPGDWALFAGGIVIESAFFGRYTNRADVPLVVDGGIRLAGARVLGGLFFDGVTVSNPGGIALHGDNLAVFGRMSCGDGFGVEGDLQMPRARVDGELSFAGAHLLDAASVLTLTNTSVTDLNLRAAEPIASVVDLRHARCDVLRDEYASWPSRVALDGLEYQTIDSDTRGLRVASRLAWLGRDRDGYRSQPYEQLATWYRRHGADGDARRILLAKQRRRRRELRLPARVVGRVLEWTVGYGYRPWRAALWLLVALGIGTAVFTSWPPTPDPSHAGRHFDAVMYSLDLLVPIGTFGQRDAFVPHGNTRWVAYGLIVAGWLLATALIAGVSRALRRD